MVDQNKTIVKIIYPGSAADLGGVMLEDEIEREEDRLGWWMGFKGWRMELKGRSIGLKGRKIGAEREKRRG